MQFAPNLKDQVLSWSKGRGGAAWSAVTAQLGIVTQLNGAGLYSQLRGECATLGSSVQAARSAPPIPDKVIQDSYAKALTGLAASSASCQNAISVHPVGAEGQQTSVNKALLSQSVAQLGTETTELYAATAEIRTLAD